MSTKSACGKEFEKKLEAINTCKKTSFILDESVCFLIKYHCSYSQLKSQHNHDHKSPTILAYIPDQSKFRMTQFYKMPIISTGLLLPRLSQVILEKSYINLLRLMKMRFLFLKVQAERLKLTTSLTVLFWVSNIGNPFICKCQTFQSKLRVS